MGGKVPGIAESQSITLGSSGGGAKSVADNTVRVDGRPSVQG